MLEKDFWINNFERNFQKLKGNDIALYGSSDNAKEILNRFAEYEFVCLVDDKKQGSYVNGYYVASLSQMIEMGIKYLIITEKTSLAESVYRRIGVDCRMNMVTVYNLYGNDMAKLHSNVFSKKIKYFRMKKIDLQQTIDKHNVISFDVDNTLFVSKRIKIFDLFREIENELLGQGINIYYFANKAWDFKQQNPGATFERMLRCLISSEGMASEVIADVWEIVYEKLKENLKPRKAVLDAFKYALSQGKKVGLIEDAADYRMPKEIWKNLLKEYGVFHTDFVICSSEYSEDKYIGLFREITNLFGNCSYLHIGDNLEADILVPQLYGMDTFFIKSPLELYNDLENVKVDMLENKYLRSMYQEYLLSVYTDSFILDELEVNRDHYDFILDKLQKGLLFCQRCEEKIYDDTMLFYPVLQDKIALCKRMDDYVQINFPINENPIVSIIIPVFNQFIYTYDCLKAVLKHSGKIKYEVIVADDCSTDQIKFLEKVVNGITVIHNNKNLKFLLNCNNAAQYAKGKYILFLNNDTQVQPNWLEPLVDLMDCDNGIGMVGSKLVYPDGCLQEAGGILWKDGSAWNYGHMKNPLSAEYNYVKEVDYISGAAIMIRARLWREIGGFDETFVPSYYEDTDLAFEVRKRGYKVVYQPKSVVVHFEGISNGIDTTSGLKSCQIINQERFFEKWKDTLDREHFNNGTNVYLAKDRGQSKKQILVVDHYVPNYDKDAGGRCTFMYIKTFIKMGLKVTFLGDNFAKPEPYTSILNQMGVEVLYGERYYLNCEDWLKNTLKYFDYIYLQRPHISIKYIDIVKKHSNGKVFYFAHDLHHIRLFRNYQITGNREALEESKKWKKIELELFDKADVGHVVGSYEEEVIKKIFPNKPIRNIPLYIYDNFPQNIEKDFTRRTGIIFVGGFNHMPNIDAVLWFAKEVYPMIIEKEPDLVWHIVGSNEPEEIKSLSSANIQLEGYVTDEKLKELYGKCRLAIVPLRYGAGVKGKVVEAAYYQIPLVTTSIGGEGLDSTVGSFIVEDDAVKMAEVIRKLYFDYTRLKEMSDAGRMFIENYFTPVVAEKILQKDMNK